MEVKTAKKLSAKSTKSIRLFLTVVAILAQGVVSQIPGNGSTSCDENHPENEAFCGASELEVEVSDLYEKAIRQEITKKVGMNTENRRLGAAPKRELFSGMIKIRFSSSVIGMIKQINGKRFDFKINNVLKIWIEGLKIEEDYRIWGEISADGDSYLAYVSFLKDFGEVLVNFEVKDQGYFVTRWRDLNGKKRIRALQAVPRRHMGGPNIIPKGLLLPKKKFLKKMRARKVGDQLKIFMGKALGKTLGIILFIAHLTSMILTICSFCRQKTRLVSRYFRFSLFSQLFSKLPLLNINSGVYAESFLDGVFVAESIKIGFGWNYSEEGLGLKLGGKLAEYRIPALSINSAFISILFLGLGFGGEFGLRMVQEKTLSQTERSLVGFAIVAVIGLTLLDVFFYSLVSVWKPQSLIRGSANLVSGLSYLYSWIGLLLALSIAFYIWKRWATSDRKKEDTKINDSTKAESPEFFELFKRVKTSNNFPPKNEPLIPKYLYVSSILRFFLLAVFLSLFQDSDTIQLGGILITQSLFLVQSVLSSCAHKLSRRYCFRLINLISELLLTLFFFICFQIHQIAPTLKAEALWWMTSLMMTALSLCTLIEILSIFGSFCIELKCKKMGKNRVQSTVTSKTTKIMKEIAEELDVIKRNRRRTPEIIISQNEHNSESISYGGSEPRSSIEDEPKPTSSQPDEENRSNIIQEEEKLSLSSRSPFQEHEVRFLTESQEVQTQSLHTDIHKGRNKNFQFQGDVVGFEANRFERESSGKQASRRPLELEIIPKKTNTTEKDEKDEKDELEDEDLWREEQRGVNKFSAEDDLKRKKKDASKNKILSTGGRECDFEAGSEDKLNFEAGEVNQDNDFGVSRDQEFRQEKDLKER